MSKTTPTMGSLKSMNTSINQTETVWQLILVTNPSRAILCPSRQTQVNRKMILIKSSKRILYQMKSKLRHLLLEKKRI